MDQHIISIYCRFFDRTHDKLYFWHSFPSIVIFQFQTIHLYNCIFFHRPVCLRITPKYQIYIKNDRKMSDQRFLHWRRKSLNKILSFLSSGLTFWGKMQFLRKIGHFHAKFWRKMFCHFYRPFHTFISYSLHFWIKLNSTKLIWMCPEGQNPSQFTALEIKEYVILMLFSLKNHHFW